jgi:hypothetical protein
MSKKVGENRRARPWRRGRRRSELAASAVLDRPAAILLVPRALERRGDSCDRPVGQQKADRVEQMGPVVRHRILDVSAHFGKLAKRAARDYARRMNEVRMEAVLVADRELDARVSADLDHLVDFGHRAEPSAFRTGCP